jgi:lipid II:glycine glycyltransferase (peptidoglycan interpeptide bridge formation enzyme)
LVVKENGRIVGGVQMLLRPLPLFGAVGYVPKGPVVASDDPAVREFVLEQFDRVVRAERIPFLKVQPAQGAEDLARRLVERGAQPSVVPVTSMATFRTDLRPDPEDILARMNKSRRRDIRRAERRGVTVRVGTEADLPTFYCLKKIHAEQRGYSPSPKDYDHDLSSILGDHFHFFLAEYEGQVVTAVSHIAFGDVVFAYHMGDIGLHKTLNALSLVLWKAMLWSKECGCAWYDIGGIAMPVARAMMDNEPLPDDSASGRALFKKSFGGQLALRPSAYDVSFVWPRWFTVRMVPALMKMKPLLSFLVGGSLARYVRGMDRALTQLEDQRSGSDSLEEGR